MSSKESKRKDSNGGKSKDNSSKSKDSNGGKGNGDGHHFSLNLHRHKPGTSVTPDTHTFIHVQLLDYSIKWFSQPIVMLTCTLRIPFTRSSVNMYPEPKEAHVWVYYLRLL